MNNNRIKVVVNKVVILVVLIFQISLVVEVVLEEDKVDLDLILVMMLVVLKTWDHSLEVVVEDKEEVIEEGEDKIKDLEKITIQLK